MWTFPKNYIPLPRGTENIFHFTSRCQTAYYVFKKNGGEKKWRETCCVKSEEHILKNRKFRADVYDPFTQLVFEVETRSSTSKFYDKVKAYNQSPIVNGVKLILLPKIVDVEIEEAINKLGDEIKKIVEVATP